MRIASWFLMRSSKHGANDVKEGGGAMSEEDRTQRGEVALSYCFACAKPMGNTEGDVIRNNDGTGSCTPFNMVLWHRACSDAFDRGELDVKFNPEVGRPCGQCKRQIPVGEAYSIYPIRGDEIGPDNMLALCNLCSIKEG